MFLLTALIKYKSMNRAGNISLFCCLLFLLIVAQPIAAGRYHVDSIDPALLENAVAVIREHHTEVYVIRQNRSRENYKTAITILNPRGLGNADLQLYLSSTRGLRSVKGTLYDREGKKIRELRKDEFISRNHSPGFAVYADRKVVETDIYSNQYPFTVEFEYSLSFTGLFLNRTWTPITSPGVALENASFSVSAPENMEFQFRSGNFVNEEPKVSQERRNRSRYQWQVKNHLAIPAEPYLPPLKEIIPWLKTSPADFVYGGFRGNMQSWENMGRWINDMNRNRQRLDQTTIDEIKEITRNLTDTFEIVQVVYQYVQSTTRYVSILLGIGGLQTETARNVARTRYGDCKALSNFTLALLQTLGIKSYYTIIHSGPAFLPANPEFPHSYFNHVILCIPLQQDTIWLETTHPFFPAGYIGRSNSNRYVLVTHENGGYITKTPSYSQPENTISSNTTIKLCNKGHAEALLVKAYNGYAMEAPLQRAHSARSRQLERFSEFVGMPRLTINDLDYDLSELADARVKKTSTFILENYLETVGNRYILRPLLLHNQVTIPSNTGSRTNGFQLNETMVYSDTIEWLIPGQYHPNQIPESIKVDNEFGLYYLNIDYSRENGTIRVSRKFKLKEGSFDAHRYDNFVDFLRFIHQSDRTNLILTPES